MIDIYLHLPDYLQTPVFAVFVIIIGYFIAKLFVIFFSAIFQIPVQDDVLTHGRKILITAFWFIWLVFIVIGLVGFPLIGKAFANLMPVKANIFGIIAIILGASLLLLLGRAFNQIFEGSIQKFAKTIAAMNSVLRQILGWIFLATLIYGMGFSLDTPETGLQKTVATFLLLAIGITMGKIVKQAVVHLLSIFDFTDWSKNATLSLHIGFQSWQTEFPREDMAEKTVFMVFAFQAMEIWGWFSFLPAF